MVCAKFRIRFRKTGDLRLISHHDLMRCFERMLRRAALPVRATQGFNPKPRLVFASPLPLGVIGLQEVVELELDEALAAELVFQHLIKHSPAGLEILNVQEISPKTTAHVRKAGYRTTVPAEFLLGLPERIALLLAEPSCWIERTRPRPRRFDLKPYLADIQLSGDRLQIDIMVTPNGSARPEEVIELLGLAELVERGIVFERLFLELEDECAPPAAVTTLVEQE